jgi:hypothetical protein
MHAYWELAVAQCAGITPEALPVRIRCARWLKLRTTQVKVNEKVSFFFTRLKLDI